jgi:hypothetical protein
MNQFIPEPKPGIAREGRKKRLNDRFWTITVDIGLEKQEIQLDIDTSSTELM